MTDDACCREHSIYQIQQEENETWLAYRRAIAERNYQKRFGSKRGVRVWKDKAKAIHGRLGKILDRNGFATRRLLSVRGREWRSDWTGYVQGEAKERAEERVLVAELTPRRREAEALSTKLLEGGFRLRVTDNGQTINVRPSSRLHEDDRRAIVEYKPELLRVLGEDTIKHESEVFDIMRAVKETSVARLEAATDSNAYQGGD